jgi:hypothetical protein
MARFIAHQAHILFTITRSKGCAVDEETDALASSFFAHVPGDMKWRRDPREQPEGAVELERFGKYVSAIREAAGGFVADIRIDWPRGTVQMASIVPKHIDQDAFVDAMRLRFGVICRRMGLEEADAAADAFAVTKLEALLPLPPET